MTDFSPAPIEQPLQPPVPEHKRGPGMVAGIVAWLVIWLCVGLIVYSRSKPHLRGHTTEEVAGGADLQLEIAAKCAVGAKQMAPASIGPLVQALEGTAKDARQKVEVAIVAGELENADSALKRLDAIEKDPKLSDALKHDVANLKTIYTAGNADPLDAAARERLTQRYGFLGKLALSFGRPDSDPLRQSVLQIAKRAAISVLGFEGVLGVLGIGGFFLLVVGIVLIATGVLRLRYIRMPGDSTVYVAMFAVYLVSYIALSFVVAKLYHSEDSPLLGYIVLLAVLPIAFAFGKLCGKSWPEMQRALGWHRGQGWYVEMPLGIVGYIAGVPVVVIGFVITWALLKATQTSASHPIINTPLDTPWQIFQLYLVASFIAPVIEETMFRGALFHHMRQRWNWFISATVVAFIFAVIHPQGWATIPVLASIAIVLAAIREWRGSILASMTAHAFSNGMVVTLLILLTRGG